AVEVEALELGRSVRVALGGQAGAEVVRQPGVARPRVGRVLLPADLVIRRVDLRLSVRDAVGIGVHGRIARLSVGELPGGPGTIGGRRRWSEGCESRQG